jgi:hypothetical protein
MLDFAATLREARSVMGPTKTGLVSTSALPMPLWSTDPSTGGIDGGPGDFALNVRWAAVEVDSAEASASRYAEARFGVHGQASRWNDLPIAGFKPGPKSVVRFIGHFTNENAAGSSNSLLMFCTSWPSFSLSAEIAIHSEPARNAAQCFSRSASLRTPVARPRIETIGTTGARLRRASISGSGCKPVGPGGKLVESSSFARKS